MTAHAITAPPDLADQFAAIRSVLASGRARATDWRLRQLRGIERLLGGVGHSGMGAYHGECGFQALSQRKAVLAKTTKPDLKLLYPSYTDKGLKIMRRILG